VPSVADDRIDRYEILAELGRGATGIVYKARDPELDRLVAIKTLRPARELPAEQRGQLQRRLRREAATVARLNHPNIIAIHDVVVWNDTPCIVMEYVEGLTLAHLVTGRPLMPAQAIRIVLQMCDALEYAHALGVAHRDIKPGNILMSGTGLAKLGDFSIAQLTGPGGEEAGAMVGTPGYIAPEQVTDGTMDARSDVFSLGVVLYEAVSGVRAFPGSDLVSVLADIAHVEPASPREYNAAVTPALAAVIRQAMSKRPDQRYESARAFAQALARARDLEGAGTGIGTFRAVRRALTAGLVGLAVAGSTSDLPGAWRSVGPAAQRSGEPSLGTEAPVRPGRPVRNEVHRAAEMSAGRPEASLAIPRPEKSARGSAAPVTRDGHQSVAREERSIKSERATETPGAAGSPQQQGCLSVNAVPFATVLVDGQMLGETPTACLRVNVGEHRVQLQQAGEQSPERVVRVGEQHTMENPVRLSYDFRSRQFGH
jgi:eukaryotic-like serine/threonine-protein kinase